jgi:predicted dehydrogenase/threonine dehydrogenase-like Zn-dependent dehydrogenase
MRTLLLDTKTGRVDVYQIPEPELLPGGILVQTHFSVISAGTERAKIETGEKSLIGKARARPDLVRQVVDYARANGFKAAYQKVKSRLDSAAALGYSCSGVVLECAADVTEFRPGDRVACGGAGYANHSEVNFIPRNLAVRIPDAVSLEQASVTTVGAIAMQGLRQARISFGETVVVIGVGLLGVLSAQLARAAGCRVIAIDVNEARIKKALELGAAAGFLADDPRLPELVVAFSRYGADAALITASGKSPEPLHLATKLLRDRGRIVVVGDVSFDVPRDLLYAKELSIALSRSYGPGRYDPSYEEDGNDYPVGYVRWTEQRNMEAFLDCLATGAINVDFLLDGQRRLEEAAQAYEKIRQNGAYTVLIQCAARFAGKQPRSSASPVTQTDARNTREQIRIGCIGAGGFARDTIFPNLHKIRGVALDAVATASGVAAESARKVSGFNRTTTPADLLADSGIDTVFVLTRHDSHARYVLGALEKGKPVFVEKPLCVVRAELDAICQTYQAKVDSGSLPFLMVGFNRRFAPFTRKIGEFFRGRREAMAVQIRVNAGYIPKDHWVQRSTGGRIVGELCHFVDWARAIVAQPIVDVSALALPDGNKYNCDNVLATLLFSDGSLASVLYVANGDKSVQKEVFEVFCEGCVARLHDFRKLELIRGRKTQTFKSKQDKGHRCELELTVEAIRSLGAAPIPFDEIQEVTRATFKIQEELTKGLRRGRLDMPVAHVEADVAIDSPSNLT